MPGQGGYAKEMEYVAYALCARRIRNLGHEVTPDPTVSKRKPWTKIAPTISF